MASNRATYYSLEELPLVLRVEDLMSVLGIGRNNAYALLKSNQIRSIRVGTQYRIPRQAVAEYLSGPDSAA